MNPRIRNVDAVIVPALEPLGCHGPHCPLCSGRNRVGVSMVRSRGVGAAAEWLSRPGRCPLWSGVDGLRSLLPPPTPGDGVA